MQIVLDTTVLNQDRLLRSADAQLLVQYRDKGNSRIVIPEVVIQETKNQAREEATKAFREISRATEALGRFLSSPPAVAVSIPDAQSIVAAYDTGLERRLAEIKVRRISPEGISHSDLLKRDLSRRKPFAESGKGYRDALNWEVILRHVANKDEKTVFITNNTNDFCDADKLALHSSLREDLGQRGLPHDSVLVCRSLNEFANKFIKPTLAHLVELKAQIQTATSEFVNFALLFEHNRDAVSKHLDLKSKDLAKALRDIITGVASLDEAHVDELGELESFQVEDVLQVEPSSVLADVVAAVSKVRFSFMLSEKDYEHSESKASIEPLAPLGGGFMWATANVDMKVRINAIVERSGKVLAFTAPDFRLERLST